MIARAALAALSATALAHGGVAWAAGTTPAVKAGEAVYTRCLACHALAYDRTGPRHCGLIGRRAGSVAGFPYSDAMKRSSIVWTPATLDRFIANPVQAVPGTTMGYAGVNDPRERAELIAYLVDANRSAACAK